MKKKATTYLKNICRRTALQSYCVLLFLKNLLLIKMLRVKNVMLYDKVVIEGNEIKLFWTTKGCHKIRVSGIGVLRGNLHGIKFPFHNITKPIEVCFYGIARKEHRKIFVNGSKLRLLNKFYSNSLIPKVVEVSNINNLYSKFEYSKLKTNIPEIYFQFDSFNQNDYEPLNIIQ